MADGTIQLPPDSTGSLVDTESLTVGGNTVHRERVQVAGSTDTAIAPVDATAGLKVDLGADNDVTVTGTVTVDLGANNDVTVQGEAAENAAVSGNPVLTGGRYDATPRTLGDGDVGALALDADGAVQVSDGGNSITVDGTVGVSGTVTVDGSGVTQPVSGTVTANAGTGPWPVTDNGGTLSVDDGAGSLTVDNGGTFAVQVDAALPAGTNAIGKLAANSGVDIGDVDVLSLPGVDTEGAALGSGMLIQGDDGTDRTNVLVDTDGHLQVDVLSGGGGGTQYTEDAVAPADPVGTAVALVREDAPVAIAADGDIVAQRATQYGAAYAQIVDSSGNFVDSFGGSGGTASTDDGAFVVGTGQGTPAMFLADETTPDSVDEGDVGVGRMTLSRKQLVTLSDPSAENHAAVDGSNNLQVVESNSAAILADTANIDTNVATVAGAVAAGQMQVDIVADGAGLATEATAATLATAANQPAVYTDDTSTHATGTSEGNLLMAAAAPTDGSVDANDIGAVAMSTDRRLHVDAQIVGTDAALDVSGATVTVDGSGVTQPISAASLPLPTGAATAANQLPDGHNVTVDNASGASAVNIQDGGNSITVDNGGTFAVQSAAAGDVAHDGADSGNPIKLGMKAVSHAAVTEVAANDRTDWYANLAGVPFVIGGHPNVQTFRANYTTAQTDTAVVSTTEKIVVTRVSVTADNANTVDVQVRVGFGATTTPTGAGVLLSHPGIAAGSGVVEGSGAGMLGVGAAGEDVRITSEVPTTGSIDVVVTYYEIAS